MLALVLWRIKAAAFAACQKSILTVRYGHHCPKDAESWQMRAEEMNCNSIRQQCSESLSLDPKKYIFQYHCLINSWMNATIEVTVQSLTQMGRSYKKTIEQIVENLIRHVQRSTIQRRLTNISHAITQYTDITIGPYNLVRNHKFLPI